MYYVKALIDFFYALLSYEINIFGYHITIMKFIIFGIIAWWIGYLFGCIINPD